MTHLIRCALALTLAAASLGSAALAQPQFSKSFAPDTIQDGGVSALTFLIDNTGGAAAATDVAFIDNLPAGITIATPSNASTTCTGGTLTAPSGGTSVSYSGGSVAAFSLCSVGIDVTGATVGTFTNVSGDLTSSAGSSGTAQDDLVVIDGTPPPVFSKTFVPDIISPGAVGTLVFTIDNTAGAGAVSNLDFNDNLPASVLVASPSNASTTCTGGTLTAPNGGAVISYTSFSVPAAASCTAEVDVTSASIGIHVNMSGNLTSDEGSSGIAVDTLTVSGSLPVELTRFEAFQSGSSVVLNWDTATETNNAGFHLGWQYSAEDADGWLELVFVEGHGSTTEAKSYSFRTQDIGPGLHRFRLRQVDFDGSATFSNVVEIDVEMTDRFSLMPAYPNPFGPGDVVTVRFAAAETTPVKLVLFDELGRTVSVLFDGIAGAGRVQSVHIDGLDLPAGVYFLQLSAAGRSERTQRLVLTK